MPRLNTLFRFTGTHATARFASKFPTNPPMVPIPAPVANWITTSGVIGDPNITSWVDTISGLTLSYNDTPTLTPSDGTADWIAINGSDYFDKTDGVGGLPVGDEHGTIVLAFYAGAGRWAGAGYGTAETGRARSIICSGTDGRLKADLFNAPTEDGPPVDNSIPVVAFGIYDGDTWSLYFGKWLIASIEETVDTGSTRIQAMRSFGGLTQTGGIGCFRVYDYALDGPQRQVVLDEMNALFFDIDTAPVASGVAFTAATGTTGSVAATLDVTHARIWGVLATTSAPTHDQILAWTDASGSPAPAFLFIAEEDDEVFSEPVTGLTVDTEYTPYYFTENFLGIRSAVQSGTADTTDSSVSTPTAISPTAVVFPETQISGEAITTFTSDQPGGTWSKVSGESALAVSAAGVLTITTALSSGSYSLTVRHDNSAAGGGAYDQAVPVTVTVSGGGGGSADYTVANWTALASLLNGWGNTVPDERDVIVEIQGSSTGTITVQNRDYDHKVFIRPEGGSFAMDADADGNITGGNGCKLTGCFDIRGSSNLHLYRLHIETDGSGPYGESTPAVFEANCNNITIERCWLTCTPYADTLGENTGVGPNWPVSPGRGGSLTQNVTYRECLITYGDTDMVDISGRSDNLTIEGCVFDWIRNDCVKAQNGSITNDFRLINNWFPMHAAIRNLAHVDNVQFQGGQHYRRIARGNIMMVRKFSVNSYEDLGQQGFFDQVEQDGPTAVVDWLYEQNLCCGNIQTGIRLASYNPTQPTSGVVIRYNDFAIGEVGERGDPQQDAGGFPGGLQNPHIWGDPGADVVIENNIQLLPRGRPGLPAYSGATDISMTTGDKNSTPDFNDFDAYQPGETGYAGLHSRRPTSSEFNIGWLRPPVDSEAHWDHPSPKGCYMRKKEIFVDLVHPGMTGWPCDVIWEKNFNSSADGSPISPIASLTTGSYDANGDAA